MSESQVLTVRVWIGSISASEHAALRTAIAQAASGQVTYVDAPEGRAAIVPEEAARWWEAYQEGICAACGQGSHARCSRYSGTECNCMNLDVHHAIEMERAARAGLLSRRKL
jgi:hypothetical protein